MGIHKGPLFSKLSLEFILVLELMSRDILKDLDFYTCYNH